MKLFSQIGEIDADLQKIEEITNNMWDMSTELMRANPTEEEKRELMDNLSDMYDDVLYYYNDTQNELQTVLNMCKNDYIGIKQMIRTSKNTNESLRRKRHRQIIKH